MQEETKTLPYPKDVVYSAAYRVVVRGPYKIVEADRDAGTIRFSYAHYQYKLTGQAIPEAVLLFTVDKVDDKTSRTSLSAVKQSDTAFETGGIPGLFKHPERKATKEFWKNLETELLNKNQASSADVAPDSYPSATAQSNQTSKTPELVTVTVKSDPDGAEITVDGKFVGSTPSTLRLVPGEHAVRVEKSGYKAWQRTLGISAGGSVSINPALEALEKGKNQ